jgi:ParB family chromosome partitioning protein
MVDSISTYLRNTQLIVVDNEDIDIEDSRFLLTFGGELEKLSRSIQRIGIVNPPILFESSKGEPLKIVCGSRRIRVAVRFGIKKIHSFVIREPADSLSLFLIAIFDNIGFRELNDVERSIVVGKLLKLGVDEGELIRTYLPLLNLPPTRKFLDIYLKVGELEKEIKEDVAKSNLGVETAVTLLNFSREERLKVVKLIRKLRFSKQRELVNLLFEISAREGVGILEILSDQEIEEKLSAEEVISKLRERRYPKLTASERKFLSLKKSLAFLPQISLTPPPSFEGEEFVLSIRFKDRQELKKILDNLQERVKGNELDFCFLKY